MYLSKRTYVGNKWKKDKELVTLAIPEGNDNKGLAAVRPERISEIVEEVAYWRKANQIHKWFIDNCADGVDDNSRDDTFVSAEKLGELVDVCKRVLEGSKLVHGIVANGYTFENGQQKPNLESGKTIEDETLAKQLLPTGAGFFFGSTDYDEGYIQDLEDTIKQLDPLVKEGGYYYYSASW